MEWRVDSDGFHGMADGFHGLADGFHGLSRWIPYGMSSWNHNSTLILTILRVESIESIWNEFMES